MNVLNANKGLEIVSPAPSLRAENRRSDQMPKIVLQVKNELCLKTLKENNLRNEAQNKSNHWWKRRYRHSVK